MEKYPESSEIWVHTKTGDEYQILTVANKDGDHTDSKFPVTVVYEGKDGRIWARNAGVFFHKFHKLMIGVA